MSKTHINGSAVNLWSMLLDSFMERGTTGNIWFVSSVTGVDAVPPARGRSPDAPFATTAYAISQAMASNDDVIYLLPNHAENITGAAFINMNLAGISLRGLGTGRQRPIYTYTTAIGASIDVNSANVQLDNIVFVGTGFAGVTALLNVKAADCQITNCEFEVASSTNQAVQAILTTASANRMTVKGCRFHGTNNAGTTAAITLVGGTDAQIEDCELIGAYGAAVGAIQNLTTDTVNTMLARLIIQNLTAACTKAITMRAASTGQLADLRMQILSGTAPVTGAAMSWAGGNRYAAALGASDAAI